MLITRSPRGPQGVPRHDSDGIRRDTSREKKMSYLPGPETHKQQINKKTKEFKTCNPKWVPQNPRPPARAKGPEGGSPPAKALCVA